MIRTKLTEMLGIEYPIVQGCMQWISRAPLVAAVSEAGGLGLLSSSTFSSADELQAEIRKIKSMTSKPFAVNLTLMPSLVVPDYAGYIRVCAEEGVKVMETAGRPPKDDMVRAIKDAGMVLIHKCTTVKHALKAQSLGADMVVADGFECAGHPGENDLGTMVLTPRCVEALDIPVICAGGVSTGRQMAAALMLGAEGVYMGTRFLLSEECPVLPAVKNYLVEHANEMETILLLRSFQNSTRMYKSEVAKRVFAKEQAGCEFKDVAEDMAGKTAMQDVLRERGRGKLRRHLLRPDVRPDPRCAARADHHRPDDARVRGDHRKVRLTLVIPPFPSFFFGAARPPGRVAPPLLSEMEIRSCSIRFMENARASIPRRLSAPAPSLSAM